MISQCKHEYLLANSLIDSVGWQETSLLSIFSYKLQSILRIVLLKAVIINFLFTLLVVHSPSRSYDTI